MKPTLSLITINYNNLNGLQRTLPSVIDAMSSGIEYIIIDGGSTDGSKEYIEANNKNITFWVSEKDTGIYNAMNKGIREAKGEYLLFINSGDCINDRKSLHSAMSRLDGTNIVYGNLIVQVSERESFTKVYPDTLGFSYFMYESLPHPAAFIKRELFSKMGMYDESFKIVSDWVFFLRAVCGEQISYKHISESFSKFYLDGISSNPENTERIVDEKKTALKQYFPMFADVFDLIHKNAELQSYQNQMENSRIIRWLRKARVFR